LQIIGILHACMQVQYISAVISNILI